MSDTADDPGPSIAVIGNGAAGTLVVASLLREATRAGPPRHGRRSRR